MAFQLPNKREVDVEIGPVDDNLNPPPRVKFAMIRRDPSTLFSELPAWLNTLNISEVLSHQQSESNGNLTVSLFYR